MKKGLVSLSILSVLLTACGQGQYQSAQWASGIPSTNEEPDTEILAPIDKMPDSSPDQLLEMVAIDMAKPVYFSIDPKPVSLAHGQAVTWLGCASGAAVQGGYASDSKCGRAFFHGKFERQMNSRFYICAERAASKAGLPRPARIFINHAGSYNDRPARGSSSLSMHAYARALDITNFNLYDAGGNLSRVSTHVRNFKGATKSFYNEFRQCWKEAMPASCSPGKTEYKGSIGIPSSALGGNTLHNDHIHLSYATCAG